jgi:AcrR family transcriptional regulator
MATEPALSRSARKTAATREAIIDAAQALLDEGGPTALTIPAVSERADVAVQTIYNRVGGRDALLLAIAERALEANRVYMDQAYTTPGTPIERIERAARAYGASPPSAPNSSG